MSIILWFYFYYNIFHLYNQFFFQERLALIYMIKSMSKLNNNAANVDIRALEFMNLTKIFENKTRIQVDFRLAKLISMQTDNMNSYRKKHFVTFLKF